MDKYIVTVDNYSQHINTKFLIYTLEKAEELADSIEKKFQGDELTIRIYEYKEFYKGFDWLVEYKTKSTQTQ